MSNARQPRRLPMAVPRRWRVALSACLVSLGACSSLPSPDQPLPAPFAAALRDAGIGSTAVALDVRPVDHGPGRIAYQASQPFQPASVMKLVTTQAALELLGPGHRWITRVHATGQLSGEVLEGDLVIEGGGDPRFAHEDLARMLRQLRQLGVREIRGDLVLDRSLFGPQEDDAAAFDGQPMRAYNAPPDALLLDARALLVRFRPDADRVQLLVEPPLAGFVVTPPAAGHGECGRLREQLQPQMSVHGLVFAGAYPLACGERELSFHLHVLDTVRYVDGVFRALWAEQGGTLAGRTRDGRVPGDSRELLQWPSRPLSQVLADINKQSNNPMARNLLLGLVAQRGGEPSTPPAAAAHTLAWMSASGIDTRGVVIENGSGLSRAERLPAAVLASVLQRAWSQPTMPVLMASLPAAGIDGTMLRLRDSPVQGRAYIKTGSLAGVASIAGYVTAKSGRRVIVVCMINHPDAGKARAAFEPLLAWIYANY